MSSKRKVKRAPSAPRRNSRLRVVARHSAGVSPRSRGLRVVGPQAVDCDARVIRLDVPAIPETAAKEIHVLRVGLHGATPPSWRLLEVPSAMTLDRLHEVLQWTFGWDDFGPHSFVTIYGEFFGPLRPTSRTARRAARRAGDSRGDSGVMLAQAAGEEGLGIMYLYGYDDEWQVDIRIEKILPATAGLAYPRCTGGWGKDIPGEGCRGVWEFNADRELDALDIYLDYFDPEELTEDLEDLAIVIVPGS
jgi:hypothetical protein